MRKYKVYKTKFKLKLIKNLKKNIWNLKPKSLSIIMKQQIKTWVNI